MCVNQNRPLGRFCGAGFEGVVGLFTAPFFGSSREGFGKRLLFHRLEALGGGGDVFGDVWHAFAVFAFEDADGGGGDGGCREAESVEELAWSSGFSEAVWHADAFNGDWSVRGESFADSAAESSSGLSFFYRDDRPGFFCGLDDGFYVEWFHAVTIDHTCFNALLTRELIGSEECLVEQGAGSDDGEVVAKAEGFGAANFEGSLVGGENGRFVAGKAEVDRAGCFCGSDRGFAGFVHIAGNQYNHVWDDAHDRDVFRHLVGGAVGPDGNTGVCSGDFHRRVLQRGRGAELFPVSAGRERSVA